MSDFADKVRTLVHAGDVQISEHGYDELAEDGLSAREVLRGVPEAVLKVMISPWCWLRRIARFRHDGMKRLRGGGERVHAI